ALAAAINLAERRPKMDLSSEDLTRRWHQAVRNLGFEPEEIVANVRNAGRDAELGMEACHSTRRERVEAIPYDLTEHSATFSRREVIEKTANALVGTLASMQDALAATDGLV